MIPKSDRLLARRNTWLVLGWALVLAVVTFSLTPKPPSPDVSQIDKVGHFLAYASLMAWWSQLDSRHCRQALAFVLLGLALEMAQSFTGTRTADVFDMAANSVGIGTGWLATRLKPDWLLFIDRRLAA